MAKIIALDYGKKRIGIAQTDDLQIIASGLTTIETGKIEGFLEDFFQTNPVEKLIIGQPKTLDNQLNDIEKDILLFINKCRAKFPSLEIIRVDERFTSKIATRSMIQSGIPKKKRQDKSLVDQISATLILQSYLDQSKYSFINS